MLKPDFKLTTLTLLLFIAIFVFAFSAQAETHGVNGYVKNCSPVPFEVNGSDVTFQLANESGLRTDDVLTDIVGTTAGVSGWYAVDVGNFDVPWEINDTVLINISKGEHMAFTHVNLTEAGNDQAFTVCLGPEAWNYSCACGNGVCEWWPPLCENEEFEVGKTHLFGVNVTTKRCPEDCGHCKCGNGICQSDCGEDVIDNLTYCPEDCYCGDGTCQPLLGESPITCKPDCPNETIIEGEIMRFPDYLLYALCGDGKCEGAEDQENCCLDCGCPERKGCHVWKCMPEYKWKWFFRKIQVGPYKCREQCCFIGYCCIWLGWCWYVWILILIIIAIAIIIYLLTRPTLEKITRDLAKIRKAKSFILADKITKVNKLTKGRE